MKIESLGTQFSYTPVLALVVYEGENRDGWDEETNGRIMVARHEIEEGALKAGRIIDAADVRDFFALAGCAEQARGAILPPGIVAFGETRLIWRAPAAKREMLYKVKSLAGISGKRAANPPLLFVAEVGNLYVYALDSDAWPTADTKLYRAPFCNVWEGGRVCLPAGASISPQLDRVAQNEHVFFDSYGSHFSGGRVSSYPDGDEALWLHLVESGDDFDPVWLVPERDKTVGGLLDESC